MAAPQRYITIKANKLWMVHATQAKANAVATATTDVTAHTGLVSVPNAARRGWPFTSGVLVNPETVAPVLTELERTKAALKEGHRQFFGVWYPGLLAEAPGHNPAAQQLGQGLLLGGWKSIYVTAKNTSVSHALRRDKVQKMSQGASDVVSPFTFYAKAESLVVPATYTSGDPISWVVINSDGDEFDRRTLQIAINAARTDFTTPPSFTAVQFTSTSWIDELTA